MIGKIIGKNFSELKIFVLVKAERSLILLAVLVSLLVLILFFFIFWQKYYGVNIKY